MKGKKTVSLLVLFILISVAYYQTTSFAIPAVEGWNEWHLADRDIKIDGKKYKISYYEILDLHLFWDEEKHNCDWRLDTYIMFIILDKEGKKWVEVGKEQLIDLGSPQGGCKDVESCRDCREEYEALFNEFYHLTEEAVIFAHGNRNIEMTMIIRNMKDENENPIFSDGAVVEFLKEQN